MTVILIDGKNALFRFGSVHPRLKASDGTRTGAAYGLVNCLLRLKKKYPESRFVMVWDGAGPTWRHKLYPEYKANRKRGDAVPQQVRDVLAQAQTVEDLASALGLIQITVPNVEADDVIGILAIRCIKRGWEPVIYSSDKDFMQLMSKGVKVIRDVDKKVKLAPETEKSVKEKFGCTPDQLLSVRALCGDKSDNISNICRGMGPVKSLKLIQAGADPRKGIVPGDEVDRNSALYGERAALNYRVMKILTTCKAKVLPPTTRAFLKTSIACVLSELVTSMEGGKHSHRRAVIKALAGLELSAAMENRDLLARLQR